MTPSLSGLLQRARALTDADVRELEKLADSYPYCQTAHLLLAKALHDRGSVLAGQKLRRAATGAPDRRALRRLLLSPPAVLAEVEAAPSTEVEAPALAVSPAGELVPHPASEPTPEPTLELPAVAVEELPTVEPPAASPIGAELRADAPVEAELSDLSVPSLLLTEAADAATETDAPAAVLADFDLVPDTAPADLLLFPEDDDQTPAGLALLAPVAHIAPAPPVPALAPDPAVAYWLPVSRLGAELTAADFAADLGHAWLPDAPPDARWAEHAAAHLPPPVPVERRPFDHQFALIDRFLREKPRLRALDPTRPLPDKLPDLAQRSTRPDEGVVSEAMARILAKQGKTARAVAMYEQLQARLPEKAAIFAAQIAALGGAAD